MMTLPLCFECKHLVPKTERDGKPSTCAAFPDGIPREITLSKADHRLPYDGDHGIQFEAKEGGE